MANRGKVERFAPEQIERVLSFVAARFRMRQHVHFFGGERVANGGVEHTVNRAKVAPAKGLKHVVTVFDPVADAVFKRSDCV